MRQERGEVRDEEPEATLSDGLISLTRDVMFIVLIAFSSSTLEISPSDGDVGKRGLMVPTSRGARFRDGTLRELLRTVC